MSVPYVRGPVLTVARCKDCDWCNYSYGQRGPQKTRSAVRYHITVKQHQVEVEVRRFTNYAPACPA